MEMIILVGLQAAGKSTFFRTCFAATHVHISKDNFRNNSNREKRQRFLIREALSQGRPVVIDNTNVSIEARAALIEQGRELGAHHRLCFRVRTPGVSRTQHAPHGRGASARYRAAHRSGEFPNANEKRRFRCFVSRSHRERKWV